MTNLVLINLQATGVANELSNYSSLVGGVYPPTKRERLLLGAKGMAQQATINTVSAQQSIKAARASAVTAVCWCFPEMTTPCKM